MSDVAALRQQALTAAQAGDRDQARRWLELLVQEQPRDEDAWLWLAGLTDAHDQALAYLSRALVINPANDRARSGVAWLHQARLQAQAEAQARLQTILDRGQSYLDRGQIDAAVWEFEAAVQQFPDEAQLHANLAVAYYQQSRWREAIRTLETAVRLQPDYVDAYASLAMIREAQGDQEQALAAWERVLTLDPNHAEARRRLTKAGRVAPVQEQPPAAPEPPSFYMLCRHCNGEIIAPTPKCPHCGQTLFHVCGACGTLVDPEQRLCPTCHQPVTAAPPPRAGEPPEAASSPSLDSLRRIEAEAHPTRSEPLKKPRRRLRLRALLLLAPTAAFWLASIAAGAVGLAFGINPTWFPESFYGLGREVQAFAAPLPAVMLPHPMDRFGPAALILIGLLMLSGTAMRVKWGFIANLILAGGLLLVSGVDLLTGQYVAAALTRIALTAGVSALTLLASDEYEEGELTQRIAISPRDADLYYNRGLIYYKRGQLDEAIAEWQQAVSLKPGDVPTRNLLGLALMEIGRLHDAQEHLEIARRIAPHHEETLRNLRTLQSKLAR